MVLIENRRDEGSLSREYSALSDIMGDVVKRRSREKGGDRGGDRGSKRDSKKENQAGPGKWRPLKTVELTSPHYTIDPKILIQSYVEKDVKYLGTITNVPSALDPSKRIEILRAVDKAKRNGIVPWSSKDARHDAIFSLSAYHLKISERDGAEQVLERLAIHSIAAISYVRDDAQHLVTLKTAAGDGNTDKFQLIVLECPNRKGAEEICALIQQVFDIVYTELTMGYLDFSIGNTANTTVRSGPSRIRSPIEWDGNSSHSSPSRKIGGAGRASNLDRQISSQSVSTQANTQSKQLVQDYMDLLKTKLDSKELRNVQKVLHEYHHSGLSIGEFCDKLKTLYGRPRYFLLPGMAPFIPDHDYDSFDQFLERIGQGHWSQGPWTNSHTRHFRRTKSSSDTSSSTNTVVANGAGGGGGGPGSFYSPSIPSEMDEFDRVLDEACSHAESLENSIITHGQ